MTRGRDAARVVTAGLTGIDESPVGCVVEGKLLAAVSDVEETEYGEAALNEHVRDLDWLAARAAQHQAVNGRLLELLGTVLPLSFGAIYRDDERVRQMLREDAEERGTQLESLSYTELALEFEGCAVDRRERLRATGRPADSARYLAPGGWRITGVSGPEVSRWSVAAAEDGGERLEVFFARPVASAETRVKGFAPRAGSWPLPLKSWLQALSGMANSDPAPHSNDCFGPSPYQTAQLPRPETT